MASAGFDEAVRRSRAGSAMKATQGITSLGQATPAQALPRHDSRLITHPNQAWALDPRHQPAAAPAGFDEG